MYTRNWLTATPLSCPSSNQNNHNKNKNKNTFIFCKKTFRCLSVGYIYIFKKKTQKIKSFAGLWGSIDTKTQEMWLYCAYILFLVLSYRKNGRLNNSHYLGKKKYFHSLDETPSWNIDIQICTWCYHIYKSSDFLLLLLLSESLVIKYSGKIGHTAQNQPIFRLALFYHFLIVVVVHYSKLSKVPLLKMELHLSLTILPNKLKFTYKSSLNEVTSLITFLTDGNCC